MSVSLFDTVVYPAHWEHQEEVVSEKEGDYMLVDRFA